MNWFHVIPGSQSAFAKQTVLKQLHVDIILFEDAMLRL